MKTSTLFSIALTAMLLPATGRCAYPSLAEAQALFSREMMNSRENTPTNTPTNSLYDDFILRLREPAAPDCVLAVETAILQGITSIVVNVSTNAVDDGTPAWLLSYRGEMFGRIVPRLQNFPTNAANCVSLASYAGTVMKADFPDDLVWKRFNIHLFCLSTNEVDQAKFRERLQWREELMARRSLQVRVHQANEAVGEYRRRLLEVCSIGVLGCRVFMDDDRFAAFTNQVVAASRANGQEQAILFRRLVRGSGQGHCSQLSAFVEKSLFDIKVNFVQATPGKDNWKDFIPLMERVVKAQTDSTNEVDVINAETVVLEKFSQYAFACKYDFDEIKTDFGTRIACVNLLCQFDLLRSDTNAVMMMADWLGGAQPIVVNEMSNVRRESEMSSIDELMIFGEMRRSRKAGTYVYNHKLIEARKNGPYLSRHLETLKFRDIYNERLPEFRRKAEARMRHFVFEEFKAKDQAEREALWAEFCRRAKFAAKN